MSEVVIVMCLCLYLLSGVGLWSLQPAADGPAGAARHRQPDPLPVLLAVPEGPHIGMGYFFLFAHLHKPSPPSLRLSSGPFRSWALAVMVESLVILSLAATVCSTKSSAVHPKRRLTLTLGNGGQALMLPSGSTSCERRDPPVVCALCSFEAVMVTPPNGNPPVPYALCPNCFSHPPPAVAPPGSALARDYRCRSCPEARCPLSQVSPGLTSDRLGLYGL
jgi:hypothetical protein